MKVKFPNDKIVTLNKKQALAWVLLTDRRYDHIRYVGYGGAAGGGKTFLGILYLLYSLMKYPGRNWGICRANIKKFQQTTLLDMFDVMESLLGMKDGIDYTYNRSDRIFYFPEYNSNIINVKLDNNSPDPNHGYLGSFNLASIFADEAAEIDTPVIETLYTRANRSKNFIFIPAESMTPEEKLANPTWADTKPNPGYTKVLCPAKVLECFNPDQGHVYSKYWSPYRDRAQLPNTRFIRAFATDNFSEDSPYVQDLLNMPEGARKDRLLRGSFEYNLSNAALFDADAVADMFEKKIKPITSNKYMVVDVAQNKKDSDKTLVGLFTDSDGYDIIQIKESTPEAVVRSIIQIARNHRVPNQNIIVDGNGDGNYIASSEFLKGCIAFISHNVPIKTESASTNVFRDGKNTVDNIMTSTFRRLKDQCVWRLADKVNEGKISASFKNQAFRSDLRQELLMYENVSEGTDEKLRATPKKLMRNRLGRSPDVSDLFVMFMAIDLINESRPVVLPREKRRFVKNISYKEEEYV